MVLIKEVIMYQKSWGTDLNADYLIGGSKKFGKISVDASFGGNTFRTKNHNFDQNVSNFIVRDFFSIANGTNKTQRFGFSRTRINSLYGLADLSYGSLIIP